MKEKTIILTVLLLALAAGMVAAAVTSNVQINNTGTIYSVGVTFYTTPSCTTVLTTISWGTVTPGTTYNYTGYANNTQTASIVLSLTVQSWSPSNASSILTAGWNYTGATLAPGSVTPINFTLAVASNAGSSGITSFSFTFNVTATGQ